MGPYLVELSFRSPSEWEIIRFETGRTMHPKGRDIVSSRSLVDSIVAAFGQGTRTVTPNFWRTAQPGLRNDAVMYQLRGALNGVEGAFEIGVRPSVSGNSELIIHRFFRPDP